MIRILPRLLLLAVAVLALGCGGSAGGESQVLASLYGKVVFDEPLLVLPDLRWHPTPAGDKWQFLMTTRFIFFVAEERSEPLLLQMQPAEMTAGHRYHVFWDDQPLPDDAMTYSRKLFELTLPAELLTPGLHALRLKRAPTAGCRGCERQQSNFLRLRYQQGEQRVHLTLDQLPRYHQIADFLYRGVVGRDKERHAGVLFVGPGSRQLPIEMPVDGRLRFVPRNLTESPATFRLNVAQGQETRTAPAVQLAPGESDTSYVPVAAGDSLVTLEVEGAADGLFLWSLPTVEGSAHKTLPPIVVITLDTTRRDALGAYHGEAGRTPELDAFASRATIYERAFSTAPWTLPSHASIFTGLYPSRHRAGVSDDQVVPEFPTLASLLRPLGYMTAGFSAGDLTSYRYGLGLGMNHYRDPDQFETEGGQVAEYVESFLDANDHLPLFLFINYFDAHALYRAPERFEAPFGVAEKRRRLAGLEVWEALASGDGLAWKSVVEGEVEAPPEAIEYLHAAYHAEVAYVDHLVGQLLRSLELRDLFDRALIVVTADHGELLGEGGYFSHSARLDPELVEIPLLIKWPGQAASRRIATPVSLVDLFPTVLEAVGLEAPASDGLLLGPEGVRDAAQRSLLFLEEHEFRVHPLQKHMKISSHLYGVQKPSFRQIVWEEGESCARRRAGDWHDVACSEDRQRVLEQIEAFLGPRITGRPDDVGAVSEDVRKSLEALGYL